MESKLRGRLLIRNATAYVHDGSHEIPLWAWLASRGLKDKQIEVEVRRIDENNKTE